MGTPPLHYGQVSSQGGGILCDNLPRDERGENGSEDAECRGESGRRVGESVKDLLRTL